MVRFRIIIFVVVVVSRIVGAQRRSRHAERRSLVSGAPGTGPERTSEGGGGVSRASLSSIASFAVRAARHPGDASAR